MSGVGKLNGRVLIKRVRAGSKCAMGEEQYGFRHGRVFMDQVFAMQVCEKYLATGKDVFWAFMDLEKAYDTIDWHGMWQMIRVYGGEKLLKAVQSFYVDSRACIPVRNDASKWFRVNAGLRQGCAMSPWLFKIFMDVVV